MRIRVATGVALGVVLAVPPAVSAASTRATPKAAPALSGAAVYASGSGDRLSRYADGEWSTLVKSEAMAQYTVSPDGKKVAWVSSGGRLQIRQGGRTMTLVSGLQAGTPCLTPAWSADSAKVAYPQSGGTIMSVKADGTGAPHRLGTSPGVCHLAWSADGRYLAGYTGEANALYRLDTRTAESAPVKGVKWITHVQSLSPNGRHAIVEFPQQPGTLGDGTWPTAFKPVVLDMVTGKRRTPAVKGRLLGAFYLADGRMVVRVAGEEHNTLVVLGTDGKELQRVAEPARAKKQALLQVLP
ncbi:hypothetical protein GCM10022224_057890 [Nonomuraea antimicrobica]|uniref:WD40-like Beta Propeller Repeat n=1 Tax=Nonomuraea antimicrobica TaxID=561173 RepID=A0ABP7CCC8_9ACTN